MKDVNVLVLAGYGQNCDYETAYAFELAGARASRVHINSLIDGSVRLEDFQIMAFGGGFSWGDDHGAGVVEAVRLKNNIGEHIQAFVNGGKLIIGICNGFQALVNLGLLPGFDEDYSRRSVALTANDCDNFKDAWVAMKVNTESPCIFTRGLDFLELPVRHGEGKFYAEGAIIDRLRENRQVVVQYADKAGNVANGAYPLNPNGSLLDIAGICDPTGRIFGLMPHPEAYNHWTNHPDWTRHREAAKRQNRDIDTGMTPGVRIFQNAVDYMKA